MSAEIPREVELKLEADLAAVPALVAELSNLFGPTEPMMLASTYYDTPEQALRAAGVSLRVRTGGGQSIQTVKRAATSRAGLFDRDEWECPVADAGLDLAAFARTPPGMALAIDVAKLAPAFEIVVERSVWHVATADSDVELAFDTGLAAAQGRTEQFSELELELKRGGPQHLFQMLRQLNPNGRLRPGVRTKSERGYQLAADKAPRSCKAHALHLGKRMDTAEAFQAVVHGCLRHFWLNEPILMATRAPEALHQSRVALRRLRSAFSLFKPVVAGRDDERLRRDLQDVSRHLGEARNLDVYLKAAVRQDAGGHPEEPGDRRYIEAIEARRTIAYDDVLERLRSAAFRQTMLDLLAWTESGEWLVADKATRRAIPIRAFAAAVLDRRRRRIKRRGRHIDTLDAPARHRLRIAAKKLRYASEFFADLARSHKARERHAAFTHALEQLQDHLGALNDIATGHEIAQAFAWREPTLQDGVLEAVHVTEREEAKVESLLAAAAQAHHRLCATKPFWSSWPR